MERIKFSKITEKEYQSHTKFLIDYLKFYDSFYTDNINSKRKLKKENVDSAGIKIYKNKNLDSKLIIRENTAEKLKNTISLAQGEENKTIFYYLYGQTGIGKKTLVNRISKLLDKDLVIVDLECFFDEYSDDWKEKFLEIITVSEMTETILCLNNFQIFLDKNLKLEKDAFSLIEMIDNSFKIVFVLSDKKFDDSKFDENFFWFSKKIPDLNRDESFTMWKKYISEIENITDEKPEEMTAKFDFTPKQIVGTMRQAKKKYFENSGRKLNRQQFYQCAYSQVISTLAKKAKLITKKFTWDDIVLNDETKLKLYKSCDHIKYKYKVYNTWGMEDNLLYGKGLSMLFYGSPGTGKTMAAQVIASELGLDLYKVNMARVTSKYLGDTEKNLKAIFDEAKKSNAILLFDEADSLFSKRTDIKNSNDKNANAEISFLLQEIEDYNGIVILTTNKYDNIDDAFERRITFKIYFEKIYLGPEGSYRYEEHLKIRTDLWNKFLKNEKLPLDENINFEYLSKNFGNTGAEIKKITLAAAFLAAAENSDTVSMHHVLVAIKDVTNTGLDKFKEYEDTVRKALGLPVSEEE